MGEGGGGLPTAGLCDSVLFARIRSSSLLVKKGRKEGVAPSHNLKQYTYLVHPKFPEREKCFIFLPCAGLLDLLGAITGYGRRPCPLGLRCRRRP